MPTNRHLRTRTRREAIDPALWAILTDAPLPADANPILVMEGRSYTYMRPLWDEHRAGILADWIKAHPGARPAMWWVFDAPRLAPDKLGRWAGTMYGPRMIETRRKLRGDGRPLHETLNYAPAYHYGIPAWLGDPGNPPEFETQHAYLKRHGLLLPAERNKVA